MIHYKVSIANSHRHFITFEARFPTYGREVLELQLAAWRPGRYELGKFSKNIRGWRAYRKDDTPLEARKSSSDRWSIHCAGIDTVVIRYEYYGPDLNAGSTYLDEEQLYINPVNCFFYDPSEMIAEYRIDFELPGDYIIACGLQKASSHSLIARGFDELADSPLIASSTIRHMDYTMEGIVFHIWIQGEVRLEEARMINEFAAFTKSMFAIFGDIPCEEYHFLFHFTPYFVRHGVEHRNSTVIAMGPAADFQNDNLFKDLLGISCHELFHTWNVKCIRPIEMLPYDFTQENYSRLGYVYEGVTTYYGDLLLWRTGAISDAEWFQTIEKRLQEHFDNHGRFNLSVADSSFDTWLDGYSSGIPWRKVSIYNEGFLIALLCDLMIIAQSECKSSLDDVMLNLYRDFGKKGKGYTEQDYFSLVTTAGGAGIVEVFTQLVYGTSDYLPFLMEAFGSVGMSMTPTLAGRWSDAYLGLSVEETNQKITVLSVAPDSPADRAGLWIGDEIIALNGKIPYKNFQLMLRMNDGPVQLDIVRKGRQQVVAIEVDGKTWSVRYRLAKLEQSNNMQLSRYDKWKFA